MYNTDLEKLRVKMFEKKISQRKLAKSLGLAVASISRKLNGKSEFTIKEAREICSQLELSPNDIFFTQSVPSTQR